MFLDKTPEGSRPDTFALPTYRQETLRHILLGDCGALIDGINHLVSLGYCDRIAWSEPAQRRIYQRHDSPTRGHQALKLAL